MMYSSGTISKIITARKIVWTSFCVFVCLVISTARDCTSIAYMYTKRITTIAHWDVKRLLDHVYSPYHLFVWLKKSFFVCGNSLSLAIHSYCLYTSRIRFVSDHFIQCSTVSVEQNWLCSLFVMLIATLLLRPNRVKSSQAKPQQTRINQK